MAEEIIELDPCRWKVTINNFQFKKIVALSPQVNNFLKKCFEEISIHVL